MEENPYEPPKTHIATKPTRLNRYLYAGGVTIVAIVVVVTFLIGVTLLQNFLLRLVDAHE